MGCCYAPGCHSWLLFAGSSVAVRFFILSHLMCLFAAPACIRSPLFLSRSCSVAFLWVRGVVSYGSLPPRREVVFQLCRAFLLSRCCALSLLYTPPHFSVSPFSFVAPLCAHVLSRSPLYFYSRLQQLHSGGHLRRLLRSVMKQR